MENTGIRWLDKVLLQKDGDGSDRSVPAHREAPTGLDEENSDVTIVPGRLVENTPRHDVVTPGFKHQSSSYPVVCPQKVVPPLHHGRSVESWAPLTHHPDRVSARVGIDAGIGMGSHGFEVLFQFERASCEPDEIVDYTI